MKIEIVTTPNEALKETGFGSFRACQSVLQSIKEIGHDVELNVCSTAEDLKLIVDKKPDLVIPAVKYLQVENGKDIWLAEYFNDQGINFTGSLQAAITYDSNKVQAKSFLSGRGIKTARYFTAIPGEYNHASDLPVAFPLFLKPQDAANGNGIDDLSLVNNFDEYESKLSCLYSEFKQPVLVEEFLEGREFTVAVIKTHDDILIAAVIEVIPPQSTNGLRILGHKAKQEDTEYFRKCDNSEIYNKIRKLAIDVFNHLDVRDFGRIDIKLNKDEECFFMEANLVPGMSSGTSYFPRAFEIAHALSYDNVVRMMIEAGIYRVPSTLTAIRDYHKDKLPLPLPYHKSLLKRCNQWINRW